MSSDADKRASVCFNMVSAQADALMVFGDGDPTP